MDTSRGQHFSLRHGQVRQEVRVEDRLLAELPDEASQVLLHVQ